jgi:hypothetical protein
LFLTRSFQLYLANSTVVRLLIMRFSSTPPKNCYRSEVIIQLRGKCS